MQEKEIGTGYQKTLDTTIHVVYTLVVTHKLSMKQQKFVDAYEGNATEAADKAGYAHPGQQGYALLKNLQITQAIEDRHKNQPSPIVSGVEERRAQLTELSKTSKDGHIIIKAIDTINKMDAIYIKKIEDVTNYKGMSDEEVTEAVIEDLLTDESARSKLFKAMAERGFVVSGG